MPLIREPLKDKAQTVNRIFQLAKKFSGDLDSIYINKGGRPFPVSDLSLVDFYKFVKSIPYQRDEKPIEIVARPKIIIDRYLEGEGRDCKKAAVLMGAYFERHDIPWRIATVSTRSDKKIHHVFPQVKINGQFLNADATYPDMKLFEEKTVSKVEYFT